MDFINFKRYINSLYLDTNKFYIIGSGVLLMYGLISEVRDVNLLVSDDVFNDLKDVFNLSHSNEFSYVYHISNKLSICEGLIRREDFVKIEGIPVKRLDHQLMWYQNSLREKDREKVLRINNYINRGGKI